MNVIDADGSYVGSGIALAGRGFEWKVNRVSMIK
jgi:hypothetical protein